MPSVESEVWGLECGRSAKCEVQSVEQRVRIAHAECELRSVLCRVQDYRVRGGEWQMWSDSFPMGTCRVFYRYNRVSGSFQVSDLADADLLDEFALQSWGPGCTLAFVYSWREPRHTVTPMSRSALGSTRAETRSFPETWGCLTFGISKG